MKYLMEIKMVKKGTRYLGHNVNLIFGGYPHLDLLKN